MGIMVLFFLWIWKQNFTSHNIWKIALELGLIHPITLHCKCPQLTRLYNHMQMKVTVMHNLILAKSLLTKHWACKAKVLISSCQPLSLTTILFPSYPYLSMLYVSCLHAFCLYSWVLTGNCRYLYAVNLSLLLFWEEL